MTAPGAAEGYVGKVPPRDRLVALFAVGVLCALAWAYLFSQAAGMPRMEGEDSLTISQLATWTLQELGFLFVMWSVMMVAMMLPSAAPVLLLFASLNERRAERSAAVPTGVFILGYLLTWTAFSATASSAQWLLHRGALLSEGMVSASPVLGGALLVAAGLFQWTPLKNVCIRECRSPLSFLLREWREGVIGALRMGMRHGVYCVGCCWALMTLLFVGGVMNLLWVAALSVLVLIEKTAPAGEWIAKAAGVAMLGSGGWILVLALTGT